MGEQEMDLIRNSGSDLDFRDNGIQGCVRLSDLLSIPDSKWYWWYSNNRSFDRDFMANTVSPVTFFCRKWYAV